MNTLVLNCGSSSVKYSLWDIPAEKKIISGIIDCIHVAGIPCKHIRNNDSIPEEINIDNHAEAVAYIINLIKKIGVNIAAIGHRVVQGGERFKESTLINEEVKDAISHYFDIAPLHNPPNLEGVIACEKNYPGVPNVAVFDTAFHQTIPEVASTYAIPKYLAKKHGIRRYGFHGISHKYVSEELTKRFPTIKKIISCHLGNGSSITAIDSGRSIDTSMGFSPLEGLVMGTRPGDLDPEIPIYLMEKEGLKTGEMLSILNRQSGVAGISGISSDMRKLLNSDDPAAALAVDVYCYRVKKYIGAYTAILDGCDAIIFTAGIGENSPAVRHRILSGMNSFGIKMDAEKNLKPDGDFGIISTDDSRVKVAVIHTNEDLMIARETFRIVSRLV